jgi:hypothetical protein
LRASLKLKLWSIERKSHFMAARGDEGDVAITETEITVRFHRRAHLPIVLASGLIDKPVAVPWWNGRALRLVQ